MRICVGATCTGAPSLGAHSKTARDLFHGVAIGCRPAGCSRGRRRSARESAHAGACFPRGPPLLARRLEAQDKTALARARAGWRAWQSPDLTAWDGQVPANDPVIGAALSCEQSATVLRRLLRDPLGFVWRYALGWRPAEAHADLLAFDRAGFGELVHEILRVSGERLEADLLVLSVLCSRVSICRSKGT